MHRSDAELQALVDGELDREAAERVLSHLAACGRCSARQKALGRAARDTGERLGLLETDALPLSAEDVIRAAERRTITRGKAPRSGLWAAALAGLVVTGVVAAAVIPGSPARTVIERILAGGETGPSADGPTAAGTGDGRAVALLPGEELEIAFEADQSEGTIELVEAASDSARVEATGNSVAFVVGQGSVRVENRGATASYRVSLPADLPVVRIRVAERVVYHRLHAETLRDAFRPEGGSRRLDFVQLPPAE